MSARDSEYIEIGNIGYLSSGGTVPTNNRISEEYIEINSVGYHATAGADMTTIRPNGRDDYHLLYIWRGETRLMLNGDMHILKEGMLALYRPGEAQRYTHSGSAQTETYWLHFSGRGAEELLRRTGIFQRPIAYAGLSGEARETIRHMIREWKLRSEGYSLYMAGQLMTLLACFSRMLLRGESAEDSRRREQILGVVEMMHARFRESISVREMAEMCGLSEYRFIHRFRALTGQPPHAYHTRLRIDKAKELMSMTTMSISDVAFAVGYDNPLYFSRLFRRHTGMSPTRFRAEG